MGVAHGYEAVVELVFVVAFDNKAVLDYLFTVNESALRDNAYRETIDLADTDIFAVGIGLASQSLQMDAHVLLVLILAVIKYKAVDWIAVLISLNNRLVPGIVCFHSLNRSLVVGNVVADGLEPEPGIADALVEGFALTLQRHNALFEFCFLQQVCISAENSHVFREIHTVLLVHCALVDGSRSECAGFELVDECRLAVKKIELIGVQRFLNSIDDYIHLIISI